MEGSVSDTKGSLRQVWSNEDGARFREIGLGQGRFREPPLLSVLQSLVHAAGWTSRTRDSGFRAHNSPGFRGQGAYVSFRRSHEHRSWHQGARMGGRWSGWLPVFCSRASGDAGSRGVCHPRQKNRGRNCGSISPRSHISPRAGTSRCNDARITDE